MSENTKEFKEYFEEKKREIGKFKPIPQYFEAGDYLTVFFAEDIPHAIRVDGLLTIYVSDESGELVGCKIKGVSRLVENIAYLYDITYEAFQFQLLLVSAVGPSPPKEQYFELSKKAKGLAFDASEIVRSRQLPVSRLVPDTSTASLP